jgi:hypothetical protein
MCRLAQLGVSALCSVGLLCLVASGCRSAPSLPPGGPEPPAATPEPTPTPEPENLEPRVEPRPLVVTAWAEPRHLPPGGGQVQLIVRVRWRGGQPAQGVEVRIDTSRGTLYSNNRILITDVSGQTRDRLTTRRTATVTVNAGGTRISFPVAVLPQEAAG